MIELISILAGIAFTIMITRFTLHLSKQFDKLELKNEKQQAQINEIKQILGVKEKNLLDIFEPFIGNKNKQKKDNE